jgi:hypothetical protein
MNMSANLAMPPSSAIRTRIHKRLSGRGRHRWL